jgi:SAM-dependent methyltransferase
MCPVCGYTYLDPPIPEEVLEDYYAKQSRWPSESVAYREQVDLIKKYVKIGQPLRVLDFGAYDGRLLDLFDAMGTSATFAIEPDQSVVIKFPHTRFQSLNDALATIGPNSVDIVTLGHVFEHLQDPLRVLDTLKELLVPGGLLLIEVPDLEDPQIQMVPYWTPFHHSYFTAPTLGYMMEVAGYQQQALEKTGYRAIRMLSRNFTNRVPNWDQAPPPHYAKAGINKYIEGRKAFLDKLRKRLFSIYPDALAIFGTGDHTKWLLQEFPDLMDYTLTFLSSDPDLWGEFRNTPVVHPSKCPDEVDTIICSSYDHQDEMAEAVGKRAFLIYDDVRAYDVWMGESSEV